MELFAGSTEIEKALQAVGELLTAEGHTIGIVIVGGAALNLQGVVERTTRDVDVLALAAPGESDRPMLVEPRSDCLIGSSERCVKWAVI